MWIVFVGFVNWRYVCGCRDGEIDEYLEIVYKRMDANYL